MAGLNTTRKYDIGFVEYTTEDDDVVFRDPLTSSPIGTNILAVGAGHNYDSVNGLKYDDAVSGIHYELDQLYPSIYQQLINGFTIYLEVENGFFGRDFVPAAAELLFQTAGIGSALKLQKTTNVNAVTQVNLDATALLTRINDSDTGSFHKVWITGNDKSIKMYVDYMLVLEGAPTDTPKTTLFRDLYLGYLGSGLGGTRTYRERNLMLLSRSMIMPVAPGLTDVFIFGDSIPEQGDYATSNQAILGDGLQKANGRDTTMLPMIHKTLQDAGFNIGLRKIKMYAVGGSGVDTSLAATLADQITLALTTNNETPSLAVIYVGTNDISAGTPDFVLINAAGERDATEAAQWKAEYQAQITKLVNKGCGKIIIANIAPIDMQTVPDLSSDVTPTWYQSKLAYENELIAELETDNADVVYYVDVNTLMGGNNGGWNTNYFVSGDRHPTIAGSGFIGVELAKKYLSVRS